MPFIRTTTNVTVSAKKAANIKTRMGQGISLIPGKSEDWLMVHIVDGAPLFFKGEDDPCAIVEVKLYGSSDEESYQALVSDITDILHEELDLDPDRVYVTIEELSVWGWNGGLF